MNSLAVAIHERSAMTSDLANHDSTSNQNRLANSQPEVAAAASQSLGEEANKANLAGNPTEVCVLYLREKIA